MSDDIIERARRYVARMDPAISGQGGHQAAWRAAQALVRGFALSRADAEKLFLEYNERCQPRWNKSEIAHKLDSAQRQSKVPEGYLLHTARDQWNCDWQHHWKDPAFSELPERPTTTISPDLESWWLPEPVREWVDAVAAYCGVPKTMPIAAAMVAAATVLQGRVEVEMAPGVRQPLTLWWGVLARKGGRKSTVMKFAGKPLEAMQLDEEARIKPDAISKANERARLEAQISRMRRATKAHKYTENSSEHLSQLRELEHELSECEIPVCFRWLYDNINPPMLPNVLERNAVSEDGIARITIWGEEGTFLSNVLGRHVGVPMAETLNQGYSGSPLRSTRKLEGTRQLVDIHVPATYVSMCVMTQPHYRKLLLNQTLSDNGFTARLFLSELDVGPRPELGSTPPVSPQVERGYADWLQRLRDIPAGSVYVLSPDARAKLGEHMRETDELACSGEDGAGWALRSPERLARLVAIAGLDGSTSVRPSDCQSSDRLQPERLGRTGDISILSYLISSCYSAYLAPAQAQEPEISSPSRDAGTDGSDGLSPLTGGGVPLLARIAKRYSVGMKVTTRELCRLKTTWSKERVLAAAYELVHEGYLDRLQESVKLGSKDMKEVFQLTARMASLVAQQTPKTTGAS